MSYGAAAAQPAPQLVLPATELVIPDVGALERVQFAARSIVVRPGTGWLGGPSASVSAEPPRPGFRPSLSTVAKRGALNTTFPRG